VGAGSAPAPTARSGRAMSPTAKVDPFDLAGDDEDDIPF
jgi:hypothetical protein